LVEGLCEGQVIEGAVTRIGRPGIFVDIGSGVEGLLRLSELPGDDKSRDKPTPGSRVRVRVLSVDREQRRISLSMQQVEPASSPSVIASLWKRISEFITR